VQDYSKSCQQNLMKFFLRGGRGPGNNRLYFGVDPVRDLDPGIFQRICRYLCICVCTVVNERSGGEGLCSPSAY